METIGDCYVGTFRANDDSDLTLDAAVAGLPMPQHNHATVRVSMKATANLTIMGRSWHDLQTTAFTSLRV